MKINSTAELKSLHEVIRSCCAAVASLLPGTQVGQDRLEIQKQGSSRSDQDLEIRGKEAWRFSDWKY